MASIKRLIPKHSELPSVDERKRLRVSFGISQATMATEIGIALRTFRKYESTEDIKLTVRNAVALNKYADALSHLATEWSNRQASNG